MSEFSRIVVLSPSWLGDAVMALPAIADVRRQFRRATLAVAARAGLAPLFESVPGVDLVLPLATSGSAPRRWRGDARALRAGRFDLAVLLPNSFYTAWIVRQAAIPDRWGYRGDLRWALLTRAVRRPRGKVHQGVYYQALLQGLGLSTGPLTPQVVVPERDRRAATTLLARDAGAASTSLVGLAPGAAYGFAKQWPPDRYADLARHLTARDIWCVLLGRPADQDVGRQVMTAFERSTRTAGSRGRLVNLIGRTDLRQLMGVMTRCGTLVANDSGAAHLAAAIGLPVVVIFGPTDERISAPLPGGRFTGSHAVLSHPVFCRPCMLRECPIDHRCMKGVEVARVVEAVMQQLAATAPPASTQFGESTANAPVIHQDDEGAAWGLAAPRSR